MPTDLGWTGAHSDAVTGLDALGACYYDPVAAQFTSADTYLPGNGSDPLALSRYAYVEGTPLTRLDPTGHDWFGSLVTAVVQTATAVVAAAAPIVSAVAPIASQVLDATTGIPSMIADVQTIFSGKASTFDKIMAGADLLLNVAMVVGVGEGLRAAYVGAHIAEHVAEDVGAHALEHAGEDAAVHVAEHEGEDVATHDAEDEAWQVAEGASCGLSFAASTLVATPAGEIPIAAITLGAVVLGISSRLRTRVARSVHLPVPRGSAAPPPRRPRGRRGRAGRQSPDRAGGL